MKYRELFRWTFTASGLWLMLSPFLLLGGQSSFGTDVIGDAATLLIMGLLALITAIYSFSRYDRVRTYSGLVLGLAFVAVPWVAGFTETIAIWNAGLIGIFLALVALHEVFQKNPGQATTITCVGRQTPHALS
jgi:hypothetical protein